MKTLLLIALLSLSLLGDEYTAKVKILDSIFSQTSIKQDLTFWSDNKMILSQLQNNHNVTNDCNKATFLIIENKRHVPKRCLEKQVYIFVLDYKLLSKIPQSFGALFWKKARANIVILKPRIKSQNITISDNLKSYLEDQIW
ncbi:hypothetical protein SAMN06314042_10526 [Epsilonproteobacteria bacterium SCGC AD-308-O04]|jgi:hypothetical protein|nr:hypothetical protein SAMN06314042_10526 [Epsilonproteobacteria bacterium SCGC AD-308-O04]